MDDLIPLRRPRPSVPRPRHGGAELRVALVVMPFFSRFFPSIQAGLLTAIGRTRGHSVTPFHLNLDFAKWLGARKYEALCNHRGTVSGEWLFAREAFGEEAPADETAFFEACAYRLPPTLRDAGLDEEGYSAIRRDVVPRYLDHLMTAVPWGDFDVVGFTSTFEQNVASFAIAKRIKEAYPDVLTIFGGANFDGEMGVELTRSMPMIDYAVVGEGDEAFPELLDAIRDGRDPASVPGVVSRDATGRVAPPIARPPFERLDSLPTPDYREYFERSEHLRLSSPERRRELRVPFESARGCWWGQKHHCTFCGLNSQTMKFRSKSSKRLAEELAELTLQTSSFRFQAVDNIMEPSFLTELLPRLAQSGTDYDFFYEIKSNLTRAQIKTLADGGVRLVQPGIESLSSNVLALMRKGVRAIQQVNMLRWAHYYGVRAEWNLLWGFPGETAEDYREQVSLIRRLWHIHPPMSGNRIWMERFSPIYADAAFAKKWIAPERSYPHVYPARVDLARIAYFFDYELENTLPDEAYLELADLLHEWRRVWAKNLRTPSMTFASSPHLVRIDDRRDPGAPKTILLRDLEASVYTACSDAPRTARAVSHTLGYDEGAVERALSSFDERALIMREGDKFLSLAIPLVNGR